MRFPGSFSTYCFYGGRFEEEVVRPMKRIVEGKMRKFLVGQARKFDPCLQGNGKTFNVECINVASSSLCLEGPF